MNLNMKNKCYLIHEAIQKIIGERSNLICNKLSKFHLKNSDINLQWVQVQICKNELLFLRLINIERQIQIYHLNNLDLESHNKYPLISLDILLNQNHLKLKMQKNVKTVKLLKNLSLLLNQLLINYAKKFQSGKTFVCKRKKRCARLKLTTSLLKSLSDFNPEQTKLLTMKTDQYGNFMVLQKVL